LTTSTRKKIFDIFGLQMKVTKCKNTHFEFEFIDPLTTKVIRQQETIQKSNDKPFFVKLQ
jgi:hypothetical protein